MAYGNGDKKKLHKACPLGVGDLTTSKMSALMLLRDRYIAAANEMARAVFVDEPLCAIPEKDDISRELCCIQKSSSGLNKAYFEKARIAVAEHLVEIGKRYFNQLVGRLAHCGEKIEPNTYRCDSPPRAQSPQRKGREPSNRKYYFVPEEIQDVISEPELAELESIGKGGGFDKVVDLFRRVVIEDETPDFSANQVAVIREIHRQAHERYSVPVYGRDSEFVCQIHLDYRLIREKNGVLRIDRCARLLQDDSNARYHTFLDISNPVPRNGSIRIPLSLTRKTLHHLGDEGRVKSLILEIGNGRVGLRAVITKDPCAACDINDYETLIGRDFGYANTVTLSVVKRDRKIEPDEIARVQSFDKDQAREYLESRVHRADNVLHRDRYEGRRFLDLIDRHSRKIDGIRKQIDLLYNKIGRIKGVLVGYLGLEQDGMVPRKIDPGAPLIAGVHGKFFSLLARVLELKKLRRRVYSKIAAAKKSWFGFLSKIEVKLARKYNGAIVREDLTIVVPEKDSPNYKGRTFNKMINNGSKGQYIRRASDKHRWNGIPERDVPSYFTSSTCTIHSIVDLAMRSGEKFSCPICASPRHADENAADTIANYLLLRPLQQ